MRIKMVFFLVRVAIGFNIEGKVLNRRGMWWSCGWGGGEPRGI